MPLKRTETGLERTKDIKTIDCIAYESKSIAERFRAVLSDMDVFHEIHMPFPPSVNNYYTVANGRKILSRKGRLYHQICGFSTKKPKTINFNVSVVFDILMPDRRKRDVDNLVKPMLDVLVRNGYIFDDSLVKRLIVTENGVKRGGEVICRILAF